jgi:ubiquinone/menaquinone biosynthesis C-methylase UbiE
MSLTGEIRQAYDSSGDAWNSGPATVYRALAQPVLDAAGDVAGRRALDVGTGSGVLADELVRRGASVIGVDLSLSMLRRGALGRPPAVVADVCAMPLQDGCVDLVTASFVLNHLDAPALGITEVARVLRPRGRLLATTFEGEAPHPAKPVLDAVAGRHGFVPPQWYAAVKERMLPLLSSPDLFVEAARAGGLAGARVERVVVTLELSATQLVAWRLGMAHLAPFVARLGPARRAALVADAEAAVAAVAEPVQMAVLLLEASV